MEQIILDNYEWFIAGGILYGAASDLIGLNPKWKANSVVQVVFTILGKVFGKK